MERAKRAKPLDHIDNASEALKGRDEFEIKAQYSLATLMLLVVWFAVAMWVWAWREPWIYQRVIQDNVPESEYQVSGARMNYWNAPDGQRHLISVGITFVADRYSNPLYVFESIEDKAQLPARFVDDSTLRLYRQTRVGKIAEVEYRRRFPEWWWGHCYRLEVWLLIALSGALLWRALAARRQLAA